jgi:hypothetical protein
MECAQMMLSGALIEVPLIFIATTPLILPVQSGIFIRVDDRSDTCCRASWPVLYHYSNLALSGNGSDTRHPTNNDRALKKR